MIKKIITLFFVFVLISCKKEEFNIINLNGNKITILGHGGMGIEMTYPLDSYESILHCLNIGMDGSEFDVQMTKDSVLVAFHDEDLKENTNLKGIINDLTWDELKNAHYSQILFLNYSIVCLDQLFANINNIHQYTFTFDCKLITNNNNINQYYLSYINAINHIIQKYQLENNVCIESQEDVFLSKFKEMKTNYKFFIYSADFESGLNRALNLDLFGITISNRNISKDQIEFAHKKNVRIAIWNTHNETDNIEAIHKNPDFIQTDNVKNLMKLLKE